MTGFLLGAGLLILLTVLLGPGNNRVRHRRERGRAVLNLAVNLPADVAPWLGGSRSAELLFPMLALPVLAQLGYLFLLFPLAGGVSGGAASTAALIQSVIGQSSAVFAAAISSGVAYAPGGSKALSTGSAHALIAADHLRGPAAQRLRTGSILGGWRQA